VRASVVTPSSLSLLTALTPFTLFKRSFVALIY
jgi:hypothetical protein